ncbi:hypothetical protein ACXYMT_13275 [Salinimicrobium sp. CAU 1759]
MKELKRIIPLAFLLSFYIYASPADNSLELTATICLFSDSGLKCHCSEEAKETKIQEKRIARKVRQRKR